jgi:hypothetical protein
LYSGSVLFGGRDAGNTISTTVRKASGASFNTALTKLRHSFHRIRLPNSFHRFLDSHLVSATFFPCDLGKTASPRSLPFDLSPFGFRYFLEGLGCHIRLTLDGDADDQHFRLAFRAVPKLAPRATILPHRFTLQELQSTENSENCRTM